jgi:uncharacterized OB-fold protein
METDSLLPFREGLFERNPDGTGFLLANRCERCGITFFPRRDFCIQCTETDRMEEIRLSDRGTLHTFTVVHRASPDLDTPYIIGFVDLEQDGVRIFAPLTDCRPKDLEIGMEMVLTFGPGPKKPKADDDLNIMTYGFKPVAGPSTR